MLNGYGTDGIGALLDGPYRNSPPMHSDERDRRSVLRSGKLSETRGLWPNRKFGAVLASGGGSKSIVVQQHSMPSGGESVCLNVVV